MRVGGGELPSHLHLAESGLDGLPEDSEWLGPAEHEVLAGLRVPKRRGDWLLGRWAAKRAVASALGSLAPPLSAMEVLATPGGAPSVRLPNGSTLPDPRVSISHAAGVGFAVATLETVAIGCDVEEVAPRSPSFVSDYLTQTERAAVAAAREHRDELVNLCWSAKESALKALGEGLRLDTRTVEVDLRPPRPEWSRLNLRTASQEFSGWFRLHAGLVWTVVVGAAR